MTATIETSLELYRRELTGYCYRMLGSVFEADDAVQETMLRAWRGASGFEGRSSLRSWLYRIATNICLDMLRGRQRRALPMDFGPASAPLESMLGKPLTDDTWITPIADSRVLDLDTGDPAEIAVARETVRLAFVTAIQLLPARQRAALILCEVLKMPASEAAATLDTSVASVNSALQRARAALADVPTEAAGAVDTELLERYVDAFQRYDMNALVRLLHDDAVMSMPPYQLWVQGSKNVIAFMLEPGPRACAGSVLVPCGSVNGAPAWGQYKPDTNGGFYAWALHVHDVTDGKFARLTFFLDTERVFPEFGLALRLLRAPRRPGRTRSRSAGRCCSARPG
jgi:RNA polymerase sigma-70 factor (ECF subfamily)